MFRVLLLALFAWVIPGVIQANECGDGDGDDCVYFAQNVAVPDDVFYQAIVCRAADGESCETPIFRFPPDMYRGRLAGGMNAPIWSPVAMGFDWTVPDNVRDLPFEERMVTLRTRDIVTEINNLGLGITLVESRDKPQILITLDRGQIKNFDLTNYPGGAYFQVYAERRCAVGEECPIRYAVVWINPDMLRSDLLRRLMRQEITQALGLINDLAGPYYYSGYAAGLCRTVLNEGPIPPGRVEDPGFCLQDIEALRRHYPPLEPIPRPRMRPENWPPASDVALQAVSLEN